MRTAPRIALLAFAFAAPAAASSVLEYPDLGATQLGRGGAWLAYANDASVTFFNPAALARLGNSVSLSANVNMHNACFTRRKATSDTSDDGPAPGETYPEVCANATPLPIPAMAASFRLTPDLTWGIGRFEMATTAMALNADNRDSGNDVRATVTAASWFVPGANLSFLSTPTPWLDLSGWMRVSAPIQAKGDITTDANYYTVDVARGRTESIKKGDSALGNCGNPDVVGTPCGSGNNVSVKLALPIEGKVAVRVHRPNLESTATTTEYDPLRNELYDVELDLTYAQNSVIDTIQVRFPGDANGRGIVTPPGLAGGAIPPNADQEKRFKDVFGARLGGDYVVMPNQLAVRAGVFGETSAQTAQYQNIDFMGTSRFGLAAGLTYRAPVGEKGLDLSVAYMHLFVADSTNDDPGAKGVSALTGTPCNPAPSPAQFTGTCSTSGNPVYRSNWPVNLGRIIQSVNSVSLGAAYRW